MLFSLVAREVFQKCKGNKLAQYIKTFPFTPRYYYIPSCINVKICVFLLLRKVTALCSNLKFSASLQFCLVYMSVTELS